nr:putative Ig domain-containing protein [uncultured Flavobacterium sp.]
MKQKILFSLNCIKIISFGYLLFFILLCSTDLNAQLAPNISYVSPQPYKLGMAITPLSPKTTAGLVPNELQGVTTFVGSSGNLNIPRSGVFDATGNLFVTSSGKHTILKITPSGVVSVFAGTSGTSGNTNGIGTAAKFYFPMGIAIDSNDNLFVCDSNNQSIRKITPAGVVSTLAGGGSAPGNTDGTGAGAGFSIPSKIVVDSNNNLFVGEPIRIRKVTQGGVVTTVAGGPFSGNIDGNGINASFSSIRGMCIDANNVIYITDNNSIRKMTSQYDVTTIAGKVTSGNINGTGTEATFNLPEGIVVDASGNLYVGDSGNFIIRKITPSGVVTNYAFKGTYGTDIVNGSLANSTVKDDISCMTFDTAKNNIYIVERLAYVIRKLSRYGYSVSPALPAGLSLDGTGVISGTPTALSPTQNYTVTATNASGSSNSVVSITVSLATPTITAKPAILMSSTSANVSGSITDLGATNPTDYGFVWSTNPSPTTDLTTKISLGSRSATGTFTGSLTGLTPNTTYYVRGYATNSVGTDYSNEVVFATNFNPVITPISNGLNFIFNFAQQSLITAGNLTVKLFGSIFKPNSVFSIRLFSDPVTLASGTIASTGTLNETILLPANTPSGVHHIVVDAELADGTFVQKNVAITVAEDGSVTYGNDVVIMNIQENTNTVATLSATDSDVPAQSLTYTITGGEDAAKFSIDGTSGILTLVSPADFEIPTDANNDNVYVVDVSVADSGSLNKSDQNTIYVTINNTAEAPTLNSPSTSPAITGATLGGTVVSDGGGGLITERGIVYALTNVNANPILGGTGVTKVTKTGTIGAFSAIANGLTANSSYTFKAYAVNATGTAYTGTGSFTTLGVNSGPSFSYESPQNYELTKAITALNPSNMGTAIPALTYKQVSTVAGTTAGFLDGTGTAAKMDGPLGMKLDADGNVYFIDSANQRIRKMTPSGVVTTIAGDGYYAFFYGRFKDNATGTVASFNWPSDLALDTTNNCLYVADKENDRIRKVSLTAPYAVTTFAGSGTSSSVDGIGTAATFKKPSGITIDPSGTYLYVTDRAGNKIRRITISSAQVVTIAGSGTQSTLDNATGTAATFNDPTGIAVDANFVYVSDFGGHKIRKIAKTSPYAVTTIAGSGTKSSVDGSGTAATFDNPYGMTIDGAGNLLVAEWGNKIRKITPSGLVSTIAGSSTASSLDGNGTAATFNEPANIVINPTTGIAYVSEWTGDRIRKINLGGYTISASLPAGLSFNGTNGTISGTPTTVSIPTEYTVSGYNYYGKSTAVISISIATVPTITTTGVSAITTTTASSGGNVLYNGGGPLLEKGICWSLNPNPTISDHKIVDGTTDLGVFTNAITGLNIGTTYYVKAYATNAVATGYSAEVSFTTAVLPPNIAYNTTNNFIVNSAISSLTPNNTGGNILLPNMVSSFAGTKGVYNPITDGQGVSAVFSAPASLSANASGNIFVSEIGSNLIRKITASGFVSTIAGGTAGSFNNPSGVAADNSGNVYVADSYNNRIQKITPSGVVSTLAGTGIGGYTDGIGTSAQFNAPAAIAVDASGNVYVADGSYTVRKITPEGNVSTLAGGYLLSGDTDGLGSLARFGQMKGIAVDASGNVYVADKGSCKIKKITPSGNVSTISGNGCTDGALDGPVASAKFGSFNGMAIDDTGNLFVIDYGKFNTDRRIRKITSSGIVSTVAGSMSGYTDGLITSAQFSSPMGIAVDALGSIYVGENVDQTIRKITQYGYTITPSLPIGLVLSEEGSISGTPTVLSAATDYTITARNSGGSSSNTISIAIINTPTISTIGASTVLATSATVDGNVISDGYAAVISRGVCWSTTSNPTIADNKTTDGSGTGVFTSSVSGLSSLTKYYVRAYATNSAGTAYGEEISFTTPIPSPVISYTSASTYAVNTAIMPLTLTNTGGAVENSLPGVSTVSGSSSGFINGTNATFRAPSSVVKDSKGNLFVADSQNDAIRKIIPSGVVSTFAGGTNGFDDGIGTAAQFWNPTNIAIDANDNLYVSDTGNNLIRKISPLGVVTTLAGSTDGFADGIGSAAQFSMPSGLTLDSSGNVYVADTYNNRIRKITPTGVVSTYFYQNAFFDSLDKPARVAFDSNGSLYVSQYSATNRIVRIPPAGQPGPLQKYPSLGGGIPINPSTIAIDKQDNIYIAFGSIIVKTKEPLLIGNIYAGNMNIGFVDGSLLEAKFNQIDGLTIDGDGITYVADLKNNRIRKISPFGYSVSPALPAGLTLNSDGSITGTPTVLSPATDYLITAVNTGGSGSYSLRFAVVLSSTSTVVNTAEATSITPDSAVTGGEVIADGGDSTTVRGVCWSTSTNPSILNNKTTDGTGIGVFTSNLTGLSASTTYYVRAYATNSTGTVYGTEVSFTTRPPLVVPTIYTSLASSLTTTSATLGGNITFNGGVAVMVSGICWSTSESPTILDSTTTDGVKSGSYTSTITNLLPSTTYYVRAYATNAIGTSYGSQISFTTRIAAPNISYTTPQDYAVDEVITPLLLSNSGGEISAFNVNTFAATTPNSYFSAIDTNGNLFVTSGSDLLKIASNGAVTTFLFGVGVSKGIVMDAIGNFYVASGHKILKTTAAGAVSTFAGTDVAGFADGIGTTAQFNNPFGLALDTSGNLYVADTGNHKIRKISSTGEVSTLAGGATFGTENGTGTAAKFFGPKGAAVDSMGNVYVADSMNNAIRKITPSGVVSTFAGGSFSGGSADGIGTAARFSNPNAIVIDANDNLYVSDTGNNRIRKISPIGVVTTLAGSTRGYLDDTGALSQFDYPCGLAINGEGSIFVVDSNNNKIRRINQTSLTVNPTLPSGLILNEDGSITGTPTVISSATDYTITGYNYSGSSSTTVNIAVTEASTIPTWTGTEWINGTATAATPAIIEGNYTSGGNLEVGELTIKNNATVVFQSGHNLTINGKLTVESGSELLLENNANLVQTTNDTNSGLITIKRNTAPLKRLDYVLWSSPVTGQQLQSFSPATLSNRFYTYDGTTNFYTALSSPNATDFEKGTGYLIRMPNDHPTTPTIWTGTFTGVPNNGYLTVIVNTGGYTALGNPYPSTMDADAFIDANSITEALYFWRKTNNSANPSYATYTKAGGVGTANSADPNGLIPNGVIQVGQGFIAAVNYIDAVFTNAMRTTNNGNQFLKTKNTDKSRIWLNLTNDSGFFSQTLVAYMDKATSGIDAAIDGRYFNDSKTALTSIIKNEEFTIQGRSLPFDASDVVPLGFKTETAGDFTLAIDHTDGLFATGQKVFLKDNLTNTLHDLSTGSYAFTSAAGVFNTRFEFRYQQALGTIENELEANAIVVYKQNDKIKIDAGTQNIAGVKVYDIGGRLLVERKDINANTALIAVNGTTQVLLVHVITQEGSVVIKKIIQ